MITLPAAEVAPLHSADLILIKSPYLSSKFHFLTILPVQLSRSAKLLRWHEG